MKIIFLYIFVLFCLKNSLADELSQTTITTDEGIEIFQNEKYYLLKKNVEIISQDFFLSADNVKAYFDKDLYDITHIESIGSAILKSSRGIEAKGNKIFFSSIKEVITVEGMNSSLINEEISMFSNEFISINNLSGEFDLKGKNSKLTNKDILIMGSLIDGVYENINNVNEIKNLIVEDEEEVNIKTTNVDMYGKKANFIGNQNIIELFENVKITRNNETITGDYAKIDLLTETYKVSSKNSSNKVKIIINNNE